MKSRSSIIDMMRAIGIILVVLGHCLPFSFLFLKRLIYLFHLPRFFYDFRLFISRKKFS